MEKSSCLGQPAHPADAKAPLMRAVGPRRIGFRVDEGDGRRLLGHPLATASTGLLRDSSLWTWPPTMDRAGQIRDAAQTKAPAVSNRLAFRRQGHPVTPSVQTVGKMDE